VVSSDSEGCMVAKIPAGWGADEKAPPATE